MKKLIQRVAVAFAMAAMAATAAFAQGSGKTELLWLGQSCFRITTPTGKVIVIDPWLKANPKTPAAYKDLDALGKVDLILVTHAHGDHFADAPELAKKNHAPVWGPAGLGSTLVALGILPLELSPRMGKGGTIMPWGPAGVKITATHAEHSSELVWKNAEGKDQVYVGGEPVGYIIEMENGFRIFHTGDTGLFGDMKFIGEHYKPDLLLIPIGGHFVMNPVDAAFATKEWIKPKYAMPMHYGTNPYLKGTPEEYVKAMGDSSIKVYQMEPGDKLQF
jgi:L-ascorbate metabolism protein UlaG (beta-lactamase superfamily)